MSLRYGWLLVLGMVIGLPGASLVAQPAAAAPEQIALLTPPPERPVVVEAGFQLLEINQIEDQAETLHFSGILTLRWKDPRQAFDPAVEGVKEKFYQGDFQFNEMAPGWYPEIILRNSAGTFEKTAVILRVLPDGTNILMQSITAEAKTRLNLRRYPFDRQTLEAVFEVLGFDEQELVLKALPSPEFVDDAIRVTQWSLKDVRFHVRSSSSPYLAGGNASTFVLQMDVHRQAMFLMRLVVMPLFLVVLLSWSVFWMERSSLGDRMSVSFVGLLTVVAYQIVLGDILPHISYVTLINGFLNFSFFIMCATVVENLIVGALDRSGRGEAGDALDRKCRWIFPLVYGLSIVLSAVIAFTFF